MKRKKLIWIDDDVAMLRKAKSMFADYGFSIIPCGSIAEGFKEIVRGSAGNLLLDVDFHGNRKEGLVFLEHIHKIHPELKTVVFTGYPEVDDAVHSITELMASSYIAKPIPLAKAKRDAFFEKLHNAFSETHEQRLRTHAIRDKNLQYLEKIHDALESGDIKVFIKIFQAFFGSLSYNMKVTEGYFHAIIVVVLKLIGVRVEPESDTNEGRIDAVIESRNFLYLVEFKITDAKAAIQQIYQRKYFQKFFLYSQDIILLGVAFDRKKKNISGYLHKRYKK